MDFPGASSPEYLDGFVIHIVTLLGSGPLPDVALLSA